MSALTVYFPHSELSFHPSFKFIQAVYHSIWVRQTHKILQRLQKNAKTKLQLSTSAQTKCLNIRFQKIGFRNFIQQYDMPGRFFCFQSNKKLHLNNRRIFAKIITENGDTAIGISKARFWYRDKPTFGSQCICIEYIRFLFPI